MDLISYLMGMRDPAAAGGGTTNYEALSNKPSINDTKLSGNKTAADLGLVPAESGKGLSENNFTSTLKNKLDGIESGAQANVIESVNVNGTALSIASKAVNLLIAAGALNGAISVNGVDVAVKGLADLAYKSEVSMSDLAAALKAVIDAKAEASDVNALIGNDTGKSIRTIAVEELAVQLIPETAQESLDTLQEISAWIQSHPNEVAAINRKLTLGTDNGIEYPTVKAYVEAVAVGLTQNISGKVDAVPGKGLSTNDFTDALKDKLSGIDPGATATAIDATLSNSGDAADAKTVGDKITDLESENALLRELLQGVDAPIYRDASGNPATFDDGAAANVKSLSVEITPAQSGSGDPYPPGGGKNLFNGVWVSSAGNPTIASDKIYVNVSDFPYTISGFLSDHISGIRAFDASDNLLGRAPSIVRSGAEVMASAASAFTSDVQNLDNINYIRIYYFDVADADHASYIDSLRMQVERGSVATEYAPYANIRPIAGATSVAVNRTGKNLGKIPDSAAITNLGITYSIQYDSAGNKTGVIASGTNTFGATSGTTVANATLTPGEYILTGCPTGGSSSHYSLRIGKGTSDTWVGNEVGNGLRFEVTSEESNYNVRIHVNNDGITYNLLFKPMIRLASESDATFEPYYGQTVAVSLVDSANNNATLTVCGGTLNVTTGELTVTYCAKTLSGVENITLADAGNNYRRFNATLAGLGWPTCAALTEISSHFRQVRSNSGDFGAFYISDGSPQWFVIVDKSSQFSDAAAFKTWLAAQYNAGTPVQIGYKLATPVTYQLTPAQLATLSGYNAITTDAETLSVAYRADTTITLGGAK